MCYNHLDAPLDLKYLEDLHQLVAREDVPWNRLGVLRTEGVRISGTNYLPPIPNAESLYSGLTTILESGVSATDQAMTAMLYLMRTQPFLDGNKRIGTLVCNKILIAHGCGIFSLPPELKEEFTTQLVRYYESGDMLPLKELIYAHCLIGLA